jgi:hypothetical protein
METGIKMIEAKAFRTSIRIYSLFKSDRLSANIKPTLHKTLIRPVMTYACPAWEFAADTYLLKLQRLQNKVLKLHTGPRFIHGFQPSLCIRLYNNRQQAVVIQNHKNERVRIIGQGEARHRKYKSIKLGGGHAYDRSSD